MVIQGYLYKQDSGKRTKIVATAGTARGYWLKSLALFTPILIASYFVLLGARSEIAIEILVMTVNGVAVVEFFVKPFLKRQQYINTFINDIRHILPKEDGTFE